MPHLAVHLRRAGFRDALQPRRVDPLAVTAAIELHIGAGQHLQAVLPIVHDPELRKYHVRISNQSIRAILQALAEAFRARQGLTDIGRQRGQAMALRHFRFNLYANADVLVKRQNSFELPCDHERHSVDFDVNECTIPATAAGREVYALATQTLAGKVIGIGGQANRDNRQIVEVGALRFLARALKDPLERSIR